MEHITYIGEVVEKLADYSSFPELFIKYEEGDPIPSGKAIHEIIELCRAVLFPGYYGNHTVNSQTLTFHLGVTLEKLSNILTQQIQAGMLFGNENMKERIKGTPCCQTARKYAERFIRSLPEMRRVLATDIHAAFDGDPAATCIGEIISCYPAIRAISNHRIAHELYKMEIPLIPRIISELAHFETGIDIHPGAEIGEYFNIDHGTGIVIGQTCIIGNHVTLYQGVTLGAKSFPTDENGNPIKGIPRHPILEDNVTVYSNATILGRITIGRGAVIGGNLWVTEDVEPYGKNNLINMSNIKDNLLQLIGKTPLVRLSNIYKDEYGTEIIAKVEYFNPGGSVKDRAAYAMIEAAETSGKLKKDGTIIEPTSGNTGIGMAWIAALKGYKVILTMPETMSIERRKLLKAFGSELVLTPGSEGMKGAIAKAEELNSQIKGSVILQQFKNPANPDIHYMTTANEIIEDAGKFDVFISCVGTGGSITGIGKRLKEKSPEIEIIAVEPKGSPVLSGGVAGPHKIQGIGAGFIPEIIETSYIDKIIQINDNDAFKMMRDLARKEGLLVGISSGAAVSAAVKLASNDSYKGKRIIVLLPDTGERYLSMDIASIHDLEDY